MPYYVIAHADPLTVEQRDALAATITQIHTGLFTTPTIFVNVKFEGTSAVPHYVGGRKVGRPIQIPPPPSHHESPVSKCIRKSQA